MSSTVSVSELIAIFRSGLLALVPVAERSGIAWKGPGVYDPWEKIERALFESLVASVPENAVGGPFRPLPKYGLTYSSYVNCSFLTGRSARTCEQSLVFLDLTTSSEPFDAARFLAVDHAFVPTGRTVEIPLSDMTFELAARVRDQLQYLDLVEYED